MNRRFLEHEIESLLGKPVLSKEDSARASVIFGLMDRSNGGDGTRVRTHEMRDFLLHPERRDMVSTSGTTAFGTGSFQPAGFFGECFSALKAYDGVFDATWISSKNGAKFALPNFYDADTKATKISETNPSSTADVSPISGLVLDAADTWRSGLIRFSYELMQDQAISLDQAFAKAFAIRFSRGIGAEFVGNLTSVAATGVTTASSSAAT